MPGNCVEQLEPAQRKGRQVDPYIGYTVLHVLVRNEPLAAVQVDVVPAGLAQLSNAAQRRQHDPSSALRWLREWSAGAALVDRIRELTLPQLQQVAQLGDLGWRQYMVALIVHVVVGRYDLFNLNQIHRIAFDCQLAPRLVLLGPSEHL